MGSIRKGGRAARLAALNAKPDRDNAKPYRRRHAARLNEHRVLFLCCGALARDILAIAEQNGWDHLDVRGLPARLHNEPHKIVDTLRKWIRIARPRYKDRIFIGYGDCGTGGAIDKLCREEGLARILGPHCFSFLQGNETFMAAVEQNATTYYLTDFLVDHFETLVIDDLWLNRRPELKQMVFGHYERLVYLAQSDNPARDDRARSFAEWLGLKYQRQIVGWGDLEAFVAAAISDTQAAS